MNETPENNKIHPAPAKRKKKKRGCCFGFSMFLLLILAAIIGLAGYYWYQRLPKKSPVEKEYHKIPDYFEN